MAEEHSTSGIPQKDLPPPENVVRVEGGEQAEGEVQQLWKTMDEQMKDSDGRLKSYRGLRGEHGWSIDNTGSIAGKRLVLWRNAKNNPAVNDAFMELVRGESLAVRFSDISNMPLDEKLLPIVSRAIQSGFRDYEAFGQREPTPNLGVTLDFRLKGSDVINPEVSEAYPETKGAPSIVSRHPTNDFKQSHFERFRGKLTEAIDDVTQLAPKGR